MEVDTVEQLDELVMRWGGPTISIKIRIGALEIEVDTQERLNELAMRYGRAALAAPDPPSFREAEPPR